MIENEVTLKKTWFIQSKEGKLEDYFNVNTQKDVILLIGFLYSLRLLVQVLSRAL